MTNSQVRESPEARSRRWLTQEGFDWLNDRDRHLSLAAEFAAVEARARLFPNTWPHPFFLHVAGSDETDCDFHIEWDFAELYVSRDGSFHLLADGVDIEGPEALPKLRELLDARAK